MALVWCFYRLIPNNQNFARTLLSRLLKKKDNVYWAGADVPIDDSLIGPSAAASEPTFKQIFIAKSNELDSVAFERKLYVIRKRVENAIWNSDLSELDLFYVPSLSYRTFVYKGMLTGTQIEPMFPDICDPDVESAMALGSPTFFD